MSHQSPDPILAAIERHRLAGAASSAGNQTELRWRW